MLMKGWLYVDKGDIVVTNEQKIREKIKTIEKFADFLIYYNDDNGKYFTSDSESFDEKEDAIAHEVKWLESEWDGL